MWPVRGPDIHLHVPIAIKTGSLKLYLCCLNRRIVIVLKFMLGGVSAPASIQPIRLFDKKLRHFWHQYDLLHILSFRC
jgi:hypothetical protein